MPGTSPGCARRSAGDPALDAGSCLPECLAGRADWFYASAMTAEGGGTAGPTTAAEYGARRVGDGIGHLERAIEAFADAASSADPDILPLAIELLARTLPLCERDEESAMVWQSGLEHQDPAVAAAVRERLRRAFGGDEADPSWWE